MVKQFAIFFFILMSCPGFSQENFELTFPETPGWSTLQEDQELSFTLGAKADSLGLPYFSIEGTGNLGIQFDSTGHFSWKPSFDLVNRVEKTKEFNVIFQAQWPTGNRTRKTITFTVNHTNRPPIIEELPILYVKQSTLNSFQISNDFVRDPDGDPIAFKSIPSQMPEGAILSSLGQLTWTPSRSQFYNLRTNPITLEFIVQDQPEKEETKGKIVISQTQQDLPPNLLILPSDSIFSIKEDQTLNLKLYLSDPNGDDNVKNAGFISSDTRIPPEILKENTALQYEFTWMPGYDFLDDVKKVMVVDITFYVLDKSNNRAQRKITVKVEDAENVAERDAHQYKKYRNNLLAATILIKQLDANQKKLNNDFKKARKGKKNRSIVNATLGATTGVAPVAIPDQAKIVSGIGGTTVLTLGTLEATEVIGRSKDAIMEKIKIGIEIRNKIQAQGDEFARKFSLKSTRRTLDFEKEIEKFRNIMNDQKLVLLELDAYTNKEEDKIQNRDIRKIFVDFSDE